MRAYQGWDEARKFFAAGSKPHPDVAMAAKDLGVADVSLGKDHTSKCALCLDLRTSVDDQLHGSGRFITSGGATILITIKSEAPGALNIYDYVIMDAQLNIEDRRYFSTVY